ncbi:hypothetical protein B1748_20615 [Paenibacillus sp. MY03]|uniref:ABC transporter permease n=1 Tax=Paenibacillus sp. MY03 TaxID=302980 RepID=UPI000B3C4E00|nr:FtsX-like permease family protein [Paenibacillus sp. MY03]OUS74754.1 hypothetical protein B1748_20615 [Paenibacillus sp. MY03]
MIGSGIVWRMAWSNLRKQWKQTLLTIAAGAIGAMLIAVSFVNYDSVRISGERWIETRLGPISSKLTPEEQLSAGFTSEQVALLEKYVDERSTDYRVLPYVGAEATLRAHDSKGEESGVLKSVLVLGFSTEKAARFDSARAELWSRGIGENEVILNEATASQLGVAAGDVLELIASDGSKLLRVREITPEQGLTGFRDYGAYGGTAIVSEALAREIAKIGEGIYPAIWTGTVNGSLPDRAMFILPELNYEIHYLKADYRDKLERLNFTIIIGIISLVAIASSLIFMRQVLVMISESRRGMYGVLRAIGLSPGQIGAMFAAEALLLSLLSALVGSLIGIGAGYGLVSLFYGTYSDVLQRMTGMHIPIHPHLSIVGAVLLFISIFVFLAVVSAFAAHRAGRFPVVEALRGGGERLARKGYKHRLFGWVLTGAGVYFTVIHFYLAFVETPDLSGGNLLWVCVSWLGACCFLLFLLIRLLSIMSGPLSKLFGRLGIPPLSVMLATKYPRSQSGRTYTTALLFALIMMIVTFTVTIMGLITASGDVSQTPQTVLGNGGYASYQSESERDHILSVADGDDFISEHVEAHMISEPFMIEMTPDWVAQAILPVTEELLKRELPPLAERDPRFGSDEEAWEAVLNDPGYIMLPYFYKTRDDVFKPGLKAGDTAAFPVYEYKKLRAMDEPKVLLFEKSLTVAGFLQKEAYLHVIDYYGETFMHADVVDELKAFGFKWENQRALGFVLFDFDYRDVELAQQLEDRFALNGVLGFTVPYLNNSAEYLMNKQLGIGFVGCAVFSGIISLMGLAVVQYRTVRERGRQIAMMRCIGVPGKQIYWMFMLEGIVISAAGLLTGWGIGASGALLFTQAARRDMPDYMAFEPSYLYEIILPIMLGLLLLSVLVNIAPARAALKLKAAEGLRSNDE